MALELLGAYCADCGSDLRENPWGAHHWEPRSRTGRPVINWSWPWERIKKELLDDVGLLCEPKCHQKWDNIALYGAERAVQLAAKIARNELKTL
jgi:hypothetical protein